MSSTTPTVKKKSKNFSPPSFTNQQGGQQSYNSIDVVFQSRDLFFIGFATILVVWAWVSIFSLLLPSRHLSYQYANERSSYPVRYVLQEMMRSSLYQAHVIAENTMQTGIMGAQAVAFQVTALWDSSCLSRQQCGIVLQHVSVRSLREDVLVGFSQTLSQVRSLQVPDQLLAQHANTLEHVVLGATSVDPSTASDRLVGVGRCYIDSISMGALSAIEGKAGC